METTPPLFDVAVIGAGPAGLMAAEALTLAGVPVAVFDAMPSPGRKLLMAGKGGLNLTHGEALDLLLARFGDARPRLEPMLRAFDGPAVRAWAAGLGVETFVGTSGRVFPVDFKAAPLLRAWLRRLRVQGATLHVRHRWLGWSADGGSLCFTTPQGERSLRARAVILAMGGGSWPQLGSDGAWVEALTARGVAVAPLRPANCGFDVGWSDHLRDRWAGHPLKRVALSFGDQRVHGDAMVTASGLEGGPVYALSAALRDAIARHGKADLLIDLLPDRPAETVLAALAGGRGSRSLAAHLKRTLGLEGVKASLLREVLPAATLNDGRALAAAVKALPLPLLSPRPLAEAISSAGGIAWTGVDEALMLHTLPGVFAAGEMLDWEAPTGGYLLTACLATGRWAGTAAADWLRRHPGPAIPPPSPAHGSGK